MTGFTVLWVLLFFIVKNVYGSFCGENALPYSFEILSSGNLVLGCAKPNCLGWANGRGAPSRFHNIDGQIDGFVRELKNFHTVTNETAECEETFSSTKCIDDGEWIGGIKPNNNNSATEKLLFRCCKHSDIKFAKFFTAYDLKINEKFEGGEVYNTDTNEQVFFDYINNIVKFITDRGTVTYEIFVNRLPCIPLKNSMKMIESNITLFNYQKKSRIDTTKIYQAPTFIAANERLPVVDGSTEFQRGGIDPGLQNSELVNVNNLQAPPNTQLLQPPPQNTFQPIQTFQPMNSAPFYPNSNPSFGTSTGGGGGQSSYYYPINTGGGSSNPFLCGFLCFSGDTIVTTLNGYKKRLDELEINDWVLSSGGDVTIGYSKVESWIHRMPKVEAEFIKFILEDGRELKITDKHFIYRGNCSSSNSSVSINDALSEMVYAEDVKPNDCLFVNQGLDLIETKIAKIEKVTEIGIYAPMTDSSNIIVNDILASCYNIEKSSRMQSTLSTLINENNYWWSLLNDLLYSNSAEDNNEIDLIPGLSTIISIVKYIIPQSNIYY